jgi:hypothetical protein
MTSLNSSEVSPAITMVSAFVQRHFQHKYTNVAMQVTNSASLVKLKYSALTAFPAQLQTNDPRNLPQCKTVPISLDLKTTRNRISFVAFHDALLSVERKVSDTVEVSNYVPTRVPINSRWGRIFLRESVTHGSAIHDNGFSPPLSSSLIERCVPIGLSDV